jgi:tetratricopeptide (TPR) repeat protein
MLASEIMAAPPGPIAQIPAPAPGGAFVLPAEEMAISLPENLSVGQRKPLLRRLYARLRMAPSEEKARSIAEAIEQVWLSSGDERIDFIMQSAIIAIEQEDFATAGELLDRVIELRPRYAEGWNKRAMVFFMQKKYEKALYRLRVALALDPHHFQAMHGLALILSEMGDRPCALQAYRMLLRQYPHFSRAREAAAELDRQVNGQKG